MFNKLLQNKKGQNTAEYAILISLVVAGIIAMQTYAQRALQARIKDASFYMTSQGNETMVNFGKTEQYEPYYLDTDYDITRDSEEKRILGTNEDKLESESNRTRAKGGEQKSTYNEEEWTSGVGDSE